MLMKHQLPLLVITTITALVVISSTTTASSAGGGSMLHVCNRGYCYYKKEDTQSDRSLLKHGQSVDVELLAAILSPHIFEEGEAIECRGTNCNVNKESNHDQQRKDDELYYEYLDVEDLDYNKRRSWKEEPKRGKCIDHDLGSVYTCNLVQILDEGSVLIEDLRDGGYLHPQPKSDFSNNKKNLKTNKRRGEQAHPPSVVVTGEDPTEDFRTVVELNMMGI